MNKFVLTAALAVSLGLTSGMALADHHEGGMGHKKGPKMLERIDTNGDGKVSKAEFDASHAERFSKMDANGDGFLEKNEMKSARKAMRAKMKNRMEKHKAMKEAQ